MINFSILGFGKAGSKLFNAINEAFNTNVVSVIDTNIVTDIDCKKYSTLQSFLQEDKETDIVVIATPNGLHYEHSIRCLKAGKNIFVENPLALNAKDAEEILLLAKEKGLRVYSSSQLKMSPVVNYIKELTANNSLGKINLISAQCFWNRNKNYFLLNDWRKSKELSGGVLFTQFYHYLDILNYWFGNLKCVSASTFNLNEKTFTDYKDSGIIDFEIADTKGNFTFTTGVFNKNFESSITIIAEKGTLKIGGQYLNKLLYSDLKNVCCSNNISSEDNISFYQEAIEEISDSFLRKNKSILDADNALGIINFIGEVEDYSNHLNTINTIKHEISYS